MSRRRKETLRALSDAEREVLQQISRSDSEPAGHVARAKGLLAVAAGKTIHAVRGSGQSQDG